MERRRARGRIALRHLFGSLGGLWAGVLFGLVACGSDPRVIADPAPLVEARGWVAVSTAADPFWSRRGSSAAVRCGPQDWQAEAGGIEVLTRRCNYLTLQQPTMRGVEVGRTFNVQVWWQTLASEEPAEGNLAVWVEDSPLLDERIPIPSEADARNIQRANSNEVLEGTPVFFHVDNHGYNSWTLGSLTIE